MEKKAIVYGAGVSGLGAKKLLEKIGYEVTLVDDKCGIKKEEVVDKLSEYEIYDPADPNYIPPTDLKYNFLNGNAGVFLHSPRLSTGLSLTFERLMNGGDGYTMPTILTGVLAYRIVNNDVLVITPNFMVDYVSENFSSIPGLQIKYKNAWAGYQNLDFEDFHSINLGADIKTKFRIGYSYSFSEFLSIDGLNIHEFVLGYRLQ